ncbi:hypothetical protein ES708_34433 [subsurface metagenome]
MAIVPGAGVGYMGQLICAFDGTVAVPVAVDGHAALGMGTTEAMCIFGFANPSWVPATSAIQITYLGRQYNVQNADFDLAQVWDHYPLIELKEPLIVYPRETVLVEAEYYQNATDEIQPIGLWIKMSQQLRDMGDVLLGAGLPAS